MLLLLACAPPDPKAGPTPPGSDPAACHAETCNGVDDDCDGEIDEGVTSTWHRDRDGDGVGGEPVEACAAPEGAVAGGGDCDDAEPAVPGPERCNDADDDCDGAVDEGLASTWYRDRDGDGVGGEGVEACAAPDGAVAAGGDCDDADPAVPGPEWCNDADDDCDGERDEDATDAVTWYPDVDRDGYGDEAAPTTDCHPALGSVPIGGDCDDRRAALNPGAVESCDGGAVDLNCDGLTGATDSDGDGYDACSECDDADPDIHPGRSEVCDPDNVDENCNGWVEDADPDLDISSRLTWYRDHDGDGFGDFYSRYEGCEPRAGYLEDRSDCDDDHAEAHPGGAEVCDPLDVDEDCDGRVDDADGSTDPASWTEVWPDRDGDGYGDAGAASARACTSAGEVDNDDDCDDGDPDVHPSAGERCDRAPVDDDCDGLVDGDDPDATWLRWYDDRDGDGYGDPDAPSEACGYPAGVSAGAGDCDDGDAAIHPDAREQCDDADTDEDCDGSVDSADPTALGLQPFGLDADGDGWAAAAGWYACEGTTPVGDCDDGDPAVSPDGIEVCGGGDEDCDGAPDDWDDDVTGTSAVYVDADLDGWGSVPDGTTACAAGGGRSMVGGDCDDADGAVSPGADEVCNGIDDTCDGLVDEGDPALVADTWHPDLDGDGYGDRTDGVLSCDALADRIPVGGDCDDGDAAIHPAVDETWGDGVDEDCDGTAWLPVTCAGARVPGDYDTIQAALADPARGLTLCLGEGRFDGAGVAPDDRVNFVGASREGTVLTGVWSVAGGRYVGFSDLTFEGELRFDVDALSSDLTLDRVTLPTLVADAGEANLDLVIRQSTLGSVRVDDDTFGYANVWVVNSVFDGADCLYAEQNGSFSSLFVTLENNDFLGCDTAVALWGPAFVLARITLRNNLFDGNGVAWDLDLADTGSAEITLEQNLYWDNGVDLAGLAYHGAADLLADPALDWAYWPPRPGGAAVDAGAPGGPAADFWGEARAVPDLGAVER